ncbi:MAG: LppX_LprAFG lipoprotein [Nocardioidaceae bacterium]
MHFRRAAVAVMMSGLLATVAACGSTSDTTRASGAAGGGAAAVAVLTKDNLAGEIRAALAAAGSAHVAVTVESQGQSLQLAGDVAHLDKQTAPEIAFTADAGGQQFQMRVVDQVLYVSGGPLTGAQGKKWMKIDLSDPTNPLGQIFQAANPGNFAAYLEGVTRFEDKGQATVDGVRTTHYTVTVDATAMLKSNPVFKGQDLATLGLPDALTSEVYVDDANRPIEIKVDLAAVGAFDAHFSDYGKSVTIVAPPKDQVGQFTF